MGVITEGQSTTNSLYILPFLAWWQKTPKQSGHPRANLLLISENAVFCKKKSSFSLGVVHYLCKRDRGALFQVLQYFILWGVGGESNQMMIVWLKSGPAIDYSVPRIFGQYKKNISFVAPRLWRKKTTNFFFMYIQFVKNHGGGANDVSTIT